MELETIAPKQTQYGKNKRSPECRRQMVGNGLSEINRNEMKMSEGAGEGRRRSELIGCSDGT